MYGQKKQQKQSLTAQELDVTRNMHLFFELCIRDHHLLNAYVMFPFTSIHILTYQKTSICICSLHHLLNAYVPFTSIYTFTHQRLHIHMHLFFERCIRGDHLLNAYEFHSLSNTYTINKHTLIYTTRTCYTRACQQLKQEHISLAFRVTHMPITIKANNILFLIKLFCPVWQRCTQKHPAT